jgi:hypothetical protein
VKWRDEDSASDDSVKVSLQHARQRTTHATRELPRILNMELTEGSWTRSGRDRPTAGAVRLALLLLAAVNTAYLAAFFTGFFLTQRWLFRENGLVEDLQVASLVAASLAAARGASQQRSEGRIVGAGLAALFFASAVREVELRGLGLPDGLVWFFHGDGQNVSIAAIFAVYFACYVRRWREAPGVVGSLLQPRTLFYVGAWSIVVLGSVAEASGEVLGKSTKVLEEWLELNGYILLFLAALFFPFRDRLPAKR